MTKEAGRRIHISVADEFWSGVDQKMLRRVVETVLEQEGPFDEVELTVRITGDDEIRDLNRTYRNLDEPTDVLSFGMDSGPPPVDVESESRPAAPGDPAFQWLAAQLGDVVVSYEAVVRQAREFGHPRERELAWLVTHGLMQLLGYSHYSPAEEQVMRKREEMALETLGLSRP